MTTLTNFFKESESKLGVFYPQHYIVATFPTFEKTQQAAQALRCAGFADEEMLALRGSEILAYFADLRAHSGLWSGVMTMLSRAFGTEQIFADADVECALAGDGFLAIYSPGEAITSRVCALLQPFEPRAMHWYDKGGIQTLI
jgi:hypothetical protein